ncbi:MAG: hypothetical protein JST00_30260 [Deltaproteobacteria bacterium]|nr:hypothetical protein [Deltaproteobacteria bacterium]
MASPPTKPKKSPDDLAEVERALSVLKGRHPEHERLQREDAEKRKVRDAQIEKSVRVEGARARARRNWILAIALPVSGLVLFIGFLFHREIGRRGRIEQATDPFRAMGFVILDSSPARSSDRLDVQLEPGCALAVATVKGPIKVARGGAVSEGEGPVLFCTCAAEKVTVSTNVDASGGIAIMRIDAATLGGSRAAGFSPVKPGKVLDTDGACAEASLDAWVEAKRYPKTEKSDAWLTADPKRAPLVAAGFHVLGLAKANEPFAVVDVPKGSCIIATSDEATDKVGLRAKGGEMVVPLTAGPVAQCAEGESTLVVKREGTGPLVVVGAPAASLGGLFGLREVARESGLALAAMDVPAKDRAWNAKQVLLASQIPEALTGVASTPDVPNDDQPRVVSLSFETANALAPDLPDDVYSYCEPTLDAKVVEALCVFSGPQRWRTTGAEAVGGLARAKLPSWLFTLHGVTDPVALKGMTQIFSLARRATREGFVATTLEALTETPVGVEVLGRTGEDAVFVVGIAPEAPWVYPLTDGPAWSLDGPPRVVPIKPLERITFTSSVRPPPMQKRRTVVFRRHVR